jgi:ArsR family transcriptional regulator
MNNVRTTKFREPLPAELLERMAAALGVLAHPHRLRIIEILEQNGELPVHQVTKNMDVEQAVASHHLGRMRAAGLLGCERRKKEMWYRIADPSSLTILDCIRKKRSQA